MSNSNFDQKALQQVLAIKVDKKDMEKMNELKSNKVDTENLIDGLNTLNKQIQHVILIQNEALKLNIAKGDDTRKGKEHQSIQLLKQVRALSQWAIRFDPTQKMQSDGFFSECDDQEISLAAKDAAQLLRQKVTEQTMLINKQCGWRSPKP